MIHKKKHRLELSVKYFTMFPRWFKPVSRRVNPPPPPWFRCGSRHINYRFAWMTPNWSMHHLLEYINQDIKRRWSKDKDSTVFKTLILQGGYMYQMWPALLCSRNLLTLSLLLWVYFIHVVLLLLLCFLLLIPSLNGLVTFSSEDLISLFRQCFLCLDASHLSNVVSMARFEKCWGHLLYLECKAHYIPVMTYVFSVKKWNSKKTAIKRYFKHFSSKIYDRSCKCFSFSVFQMSNLIVCR